MTSKVSTFVLAFALAVWATSANAQMARYPITGTAQYQIGNGLPIPIAVPAIAVDGAGVRQPISGADPRPMQISAAQLNHPGTPFNIGVFLANPNVFQVNTGVIIDFPNQVATFAAGGRTGAATVSFCDGDVVTANGNPGCVSAGGGVNASINGVMRYTATANQFGGPARAATGGFADVAIRAGAAAPCDFATNPGCQVVFALATPAGTGAQGAPFGVVVATQGNAPANGVFQIRVAANGVITYITPTGLGAPGIPNPATSAGGPWTTGMLTVSVTQNAGSTNEVFVLSGSDARVNGLGSISLVSGAISNRTLTAPNANRGWLNITVGQQAPTLGTWGIAALALLLAGAATMKIRKSAVA